MTKKVDRRGRPFVNPRIGIESGKMFKGRIPLSLHPRMRKAARAKGIALGRWIIECAAREIGVKIEAAKCRVPKRKSAA